jgi:platelet-activating factor acetylhydrolase
MYPHVCSLFLKMVANPKRALDLNINASLEFLNLVLPKELSQVNRAYQNEGLLETVISPLDRIPSAHMHRPNNDWVAVRLKIRHEWLFRISPKLLRKYQRARSQQKGKPPENGDEIWLHIKPSPESIDRHIKEIDEKKTQQEKHERAMPKTRTGKEDLGETVQSPSDAELAARESTFVNQDP